MYVYSAMQALCHQNLHNQCFQFGLSFFDPLPIQEEDLTSLVLFHVILWNHQNHTGIKQLAGHEFIVVL